MTNLSPSFNGLRVAALESRRCDDMARLIERFGGTPFVSPSMREVPLSENREAIDFANRVIVGEINVVIFLTGVGFKHLLAAIERHIDKQQFLDTLSDITTIARGPKPVVAMREVGLSPTFRAPEPNTWRELLNTIDLQVPIANQTVGLQEYGVTNRSLIAGLEARGARVVQVRVYQWELPEDTEPLRENIREMVSGRRDCLLITSAHQVVNMIRMAQEMNVEESLRKALNTMVVVSIGPTTSEMCQHLEITVDFEPEHPKMGHLVSEAAFRTARVLAAKRLRSITPTEFSQANLSNPSPSPTKTIPAMPSTSQYTSANVDNSPFMLAARRQSSPVTPVWLMRQAGRYMAEYREVRAKVGFLELCKNSQLCAEVMVTAVEKLGVDAAIIFSDLLPILEPMGMDLEFAQGDGPVIHNPLREPNDVDRVQELESMEPLQFVADTVRYTRAAIKPHIPVIGFSGAPFTLASYMIEGGGSKNYLHTKTLMYSSPDAWDILMQKLSRSIALYLNSQILAGANCVQIFDSWAGCLSQSDYRTYVRPYMLQILDAIIPGVPVVNFATGNPMLTSMLRGDSRTVVGLDWRVPLDTGWDMAGADRAVQGNLDPTILFSDLKAIRKQIQRVLDEADGRPGHIFNLGHGILPHTPVDNVIALVDMVHELSQR
ncbi:MAG: uroporphyrinogen decarboxylase [Planctomycetota bacterium]|nr:uroporphyrinogen decarboxylase [Planctomycetota bacterium]